MNVFKVRYRLSLSEFMAARNEHWAVNKQGSRTNLILGTIAVVVGVAMWSVGFWGKAFLIIGAFLIVMVVGRSCLWRRAYHQTQKFASDIVVEFSDEQIHVETADGTSELKWTTYNRFRDSAKYVLLYLPGSQFSVIPKSAFLSDEETQRFLALLKSKLTQVR